MTSFVHAELPSEHKTVLRNMCHELPEKNAPARQWEEVREWISFALDLGATGFWREDRP